MTEEHPASEGPSWDSVRAMLTRGDLLVAREGLALIVANPLTPGQEATFDRLLELCVLASREVSDRAGEDLARTAAGLVTSTEPLDVPSFGIVTQGATELLVTITGDMQVALTHPSGEVETLDAADSLLPVNRILRLPLARVVVALDVSTVDVDLRSNLSAGVVSAGGLVLVPGGARTTAEHREETLVDLSPVAMTPETEPSSLRTEAVSGIDRPAPEAAAVRDEPEAGTPSFTSFSLTDDDTDVTDEIGPFPEDDRTDGSAASDNDLVGPVEPVPPPKGTTVRGIVCSRGHLNAPEARYCARCGISTVHQTHNLVTGERPPLGVLVVDDGVTHVLVRDFVIGRDPESSEEVRSGQASALVLDDPGLALSRVHARVVLDGWEVRVEDSGSANGTFVAAGTGEDWTRLPPGSPVTITPGTRLRMGSRVVTYESHNRV